MIIFLDVFVRNSIMAICKKMRPHWLLCMHDVVANIMYGGFMVILVVKFLADRRKIRLIFLPKSTKWNTISIHFEWVNDKTLGFQIFLIQNSQFNPNFCQFGTISLARYQSFCFIGMKWFICLIWYIPLSSKLHNQCYHTGSALRIPIQNFED